jgi:hypothetical protein
VTLDIVRWRRFPPATRRMCRWQGARAALTVRSGQGRSAFAHTDRTAQQSTAEHHRKETALPPCRKQRPPRRRKVRAQGG